LSPSERLKAEDRRQLIVAAAVPLFARKGFKSTTTREIAEAAGTSEALLYKHVPSKESIYHEMSHVLCGEGMHEIAERLAKLPASTRMLVMAIYFLMIVILPETTPDEEIKSQTRRVMAQSLLEDGEFAREFQDARMAPFIPDLERLIAAAVAAGDMVDEPAHARARIIICQHLACGTAFMSMPPKSPHDYGATRAQVNHETVLFALRGMGLKEEAIRKHFEPAEFDRFIQQLLTEVKS
jgi:AcrR family transcriptional regulator